MATLWIGTSGWSYRDWVGPFYPKGLPASKWFAHYCEHYPTVELNVTFYRIPTPKAVENWALTSPPGFLFAAKLNREITHVHKFHNVQDALARYFDVLSLLGPKLGVVLIQLPPSFHYHADRVREFLDLLRPRQRPWRTAIECRHPSWFTPEVFALLSEHQISLCIADAGGPFPAHEVQTAPFVYVRFHGPAARYASKYSPEEMAVASQKIRQWLEQGLDVYVYFNNDTHGYALQNANELRDLLAPLDHTPPAPALKGL